MTDQELKTKKDELKALRTEHQKLVIEAKIEKEQKIVKKLREGAAEAAKTPEERERGRKEREARVNALLAQQAKQKRKETGGILIERFIFYLLWVIIVVIPFLC